MQIFSLERAGHRFVVSVVTDDELSDPSFLSDAKNFNARLHVSRDKIRDFLARGLEESDTILIDQDGNRCFPNLEVIEKRELDDDDTDGFVWWYKDWSKPVPSGVTPRVRPEARERVRLILTVLRMIFPKESSVWGVQPVAFMMMRQADADFS